VSRSEAVWWRVAWRNLWRNRGRTLVTASGLALGYLAAVVVAGLDDGMGAELIDNGTRLLTGQIQVHAADYLPDRKVNNTIGGDDGIDVSALLARIDADPEVTAAAPRVYGGGLVSAGSRTEASLLLGIDPTREPRVTTLLSDIDGGRLPRPGAREVDVGSEMARQLHVSLGDTLVLVAPAADGSLGNDLYTLVGIFHTGTPGIDGSYAVLPISDLQALLAMSPTRIHEIALDVTRPSATADVVSRLQSTLPADGGPQVDVRSWRRLRPELAQSVDLMSSMNYLIILIIFGMAVFGVANTMIIATFERRREFAVVRALGTTTLGVGRTVVYEGVLLGVLALVAGGLLTWPVMVWWHNAPPDLSGFVGGISWAGSRWRPILRVEYSTAAPIFSAVALFLTSVFAAVYPAWRATRVPPADALADR
jgi:ABC-type lipoprotein release transport system permease subunit